MPAHIIFIITSIIDTVLVPFLKVADCITMATRGIGTCEDVGGSFRCQ